ncbi:MAG: 16S rRNA (adenine(1518)-N(6)/adenine(1519)-N(6))-dimethyltransferase RsmA, partial [Actinobacteria bacterium]|nr:16S rRNA (adenine(1518)-N(6)/adenine(1519)-N(6))-dimethyltransferase RsmA [Actinomycetota bacterium]
MSNLLGAAEIRELAALLDLKPTKKLGQNFVVDANTCRKIVKLADVSKSDVALEIGPGLGSLTLALLEASKAVIAIEIDQRLANQLPATVA